MADKEQAGQDIHTGSCLCGGVRYSTVGPLKGVSVCHCTQCQKTSGFIVAAAWLPAENLSVESDQSLKWYRSSAKAERGFCGICGGNLFWREDGSEEVSITMGTLDPPTGLKIVENIFTDTAGDYYDIPKTRD